MAKSNKELIKEVIEELKRENIIDKAAVLTPYQKTEKLISIYKSLKLSVTRKIIGLEELEKSGTISVNSGMSERVSGGSDRLSGRDRHGCRCGSRRQSAGNNNRFV